MSEYPKDPDTGHLLGCRCGQCETADRARNPMPPAEVAEFAPVAVAREVDDGRDYYEGRHRAWQDAHEHEPMSGEELFNTYGSFYEGLER